MNGATSVFVILSSKKSTATSSTSTSVLTTILLTSRSVVTMYLTDRAGAILRHHTRSSQEGHHTVKRTGVPKAMVAAVRVRARRGTARVPVVLLPPPPPPPQTLLRATQLSQRAEKFGAATSLVILDAYPHARRAKRATTRRICLLSCPLSQELQSAGRLVARFPLTVLPRSLLSGLQCPR